MPPPLPPELAGPAPGLDFAYVAHVQLGRPMEHGRNPRGQRARVLIESGSFEGPRLRGRVLPGGADWQLTRADGCTELLAIYDMQCDDGTIVHVRNNALWYPTPALPQGEYVIGRPEFEAPSGAHEWLNRYHFLCTIGSDNGGDDTVTLNVFRVLMPGDDGRQFHSPGASS